MQRVIKAIPLPSSKTFNPNNKSVYTRFHRKPQIYPANYETNKTYKIETTLEEESMNNYINNMYKEKKYQGYLDPTAPNNKNIFIETDSEPQKSDRNPRKTKSKKKSTQLLIAKTESQFPETYNSHNFFSTNIH